MRSREQSNIQRGRIIVFPMPDTDPYAAPFFRQRCQRHGGIPPSFCVRCAGIGSGFNQRKSVNGTDEIVSAVTKHGPNINRVDGITRARANPHRADPVLVDVGPPRGDGLHLRHTRDIGEGTECSS